MKLTRGTSPLGGIGEIDRFFGLRKGIGDEIGDVFVDAAAGGISPIVSVAFGQGDGGYYREGRGEEPLALRCEVVLDRPFASLFVGIARFVEKARYFGGINGVGKGAVGKVDHDHGDDRRAYGRQCPEQTVCRRPVRRL